MCIIGPDITGLQATSSYSHLCTSSPSSSSSSSSVSVTASSSACHSLVSVPPPLCNKDRNLEVSRSSSSPLLPALSSSTLLPRVSTSSSHGQSRRRNYGPKRSQRPASCKAAKLKTMEQLKVSTPLKNVLRNSSVCDSHFLPTSKFLRARVLSRGFLQRTPVNWLNVMRLCRFLMSLERFSMGMTWIVLCGNLNFRGEFFGFYDASKLLHIGWCSSSFLIREWELRMRWLFMRQGCPAWT